MLEFMHRLFHLAADNASGARRSFSRACFLFSSGCHLVNSPFKLLVVTTMHQSSAIRKWGVSPDAADQFVTGRHFAGAMQAKFFASFVSPVPL
jgi:hypothetical protein